MEPEVIDLVPKGKYFDFPDLVCALLEAGQPVGAYDHTGLWFDIGRQEDYERATNVWLQAEENGNGNGNGAAHESNGNGNGHEGRPWSARRRTDVWQTGVDAIRLRQPDARFSTTVLPACSSYRKSLTDAASVSTTATRSTPRPARVAQAASAFSRLVRPWRAT